ncbi:hypothetical protein EPN18_07990 [bacterium]|nr:MAG: hypothetical protein EPN18_07990 [bacterium]
MEIGDILKSLIFWGPGAVIAAYIIYVIYKLANNLGFEFIKAQREQTVALARQAQSMEDLGKSVRDFVARDSSEHREMIILLKVVADEVKKVSVKVDEIEDRTYEHEKGTLPAR